MPYGECSVCGCDGWINYHGKCTDVAKCDENRRQQSLKRFPPVEMDPERCGGQPVLRGTRFTVAKLIAEFADDEGAVKRFAREFDHEPTLVRDALGWAAKYLATVRHADPPAEIVLEAAKMKDAWLRTAADFDNFRKRTRKDLDDARQGGRAEERKAVVDYLRASSKVERQPSKLAAYVDKVICALGEGLADFFERGGHLE